MRARLLSLFALSLIVFASHAVAAKPGGSVVMRDNVTPAHRLELLDKLQKITGWTRLDFDPDGSLSLAGPDNLKGSKGAQALLIRAIHGENVIVLEDASGRADIAFCRVVPGRWPGADDKPKPPAYVVLIDFADFDQIVGDEAARSAFDVGWGVLHELDHVVSDSLDGETEGDLGDCEAHLNQMRHELGLPIRTAYFFTSSGLKSDPNFNRRFVRLSFERFGSAAKRTKRYLLMWDSLAVGGLDLPPKRLARSSADIF